MQVLLEGAAGNHDGERGGGFPAALVLTFPDLSLSAPNLLGKKNHCRDAGGKNPPLFCWQQAGLMI